MRKLRFANNMCRRVNINKGERITVPININEAIILDYMLQLILISESSRAAGVYLSRLTNERI